MEGSVQNRRIEDARPRAAQEWRSAQLAETERVGEAGANAQAAASLALHNLRGVTILVVVAFHSALAYLGSSSSSPFPFNAPPYQWRAFPIIDSHRFFGFDLFCAWQDVYLMGLMFFLSALFTWPSLDRKGVSKFLRDRTMRLGAPYVFGVAVVMPIALYPVYRVTADDPSLIAYALHYLALPFWPNGPMWFLWQLLVFTIAAAVLRRLWPRAVERLGGLFSLAESSPGRCFVGLAALSALAYVPLALVFTPWRWVDHGPLALQYCRPLLYALFYFAGLTTGAYGLGRGLLAPQGALARGWRRWLALATSFLFAWMGLTALTMRDDGSSGPLFLQIAADTSFALTASASLFLVVAASLRFGTNRSSLLNALARNAMGVYLLHCAPVVWLQYALLPSALPAIFKAAIVFAGALLASWAATTILRLAPYGCRLIGEEPRRLSGRSIGGRFSPAAD